MPSLSRRAGWTSLPLPYLFDVKAFATLRLPSLRDHIERIGIEIYPRDTMHDASKSSSG